MQGITSTIELQNAIQLLESEQLVNKRLLKEQFDITFESLKPINLLMGALKDVSSSPYLLDNILGTAMGVASGYVTKKIFVGSSGNLIRKLLGSILQFGVTNVIAQHPDPIKSFGRAIFQHFFRKNEMNSQKP